jgi:hypothetical protein
MPKPRKTTSDPEFFSRKAREDELADFGAAVLQILTDTEEWDADTLDAISEAAQARKLADYGPNGNFRCLISR